MEGAEFDGDLKIPIVPAPKLIIVPTGLVPWSKIPYAKDLGAYGCSQTKRDKRYLREGLEAMLDYLTPRVVLVYRSMPGYVFDGLRSRVEFVGFPDWTARMHGRG